MNTKAAATAVFLTLLLSHAVIAASQDDVRIAAAAAESLATYPRYTVFDAVDVTVEEGTVILTGKVTLEAKRQEIGRRLETVSGARAVRNEIQVLPPSLEDDLLRKRIARSIYGSPQFWKYAAQANPPIHIVVEHGHVTLTGFVASESDRAVAQSLASGFGELGVTNVLKVTAPERASSRR